MPDLDTLIPPAVELTLDTETLSLTPLKVGQLPAFMRSIAPIMSQLTKEQIDWIALFGYHGDHLLSAIAIAAGKPREWLDRLDTDQAILLAAKLLEVNADFFTTQVLPRLQTTLGPLQAMTGSTSSSS
jgi:hypothetical protein